MKQSIYVAQIRKEGYRLIKHRISIKVRRELMKAVFNGELVRLPPHDLLPEVFLHPGYYEMALLAQRKQAKLLKNSLIAL